MHNFYMQCFKITEKRPANAYRGGRGKVVFQGALYSPDIQFSRKVCVMCNTYCEGCVMYHVL